MKEYYNLDSLEIDINHLIQRLDDEWRWDYVYGVPQGGVVPAMMIANQTNLKLIDDLNDLKEFPESTKRILIVDDVIDSGKTRNKYADFDFVALHMKPHATIEIKGDCLTSAANTTDNWIHYFWEGEESKSIEDAVIRQLEYIGENPNRNGLLDTPKRVAASWNEIFSGYNEDPQSLIKTFDQPCDEMVILKDIELYSMCEHHILPFIGKAHIAYIPTDKVIGISKLARLLDIYARRLQIQERIGKQVTSFLMQYLKPLGVACVIEAQHLCMRMRGCNKQNSTMVTSSLEGVFRNDEAARNELMRLIK